MAQITHGEGGDRRPSKHVVVDEKEEEQQRENHEGKRECAKVEAGSAEETS
jgi:hypothetical protein